ncbi:MAG: S-adenosylmethionine decarboxylase [Casimicrobiaceae bacterium]
MKASALTIPPVDVLHLRSRAPVQGLHILGEWYGCPRSETIRRSDRLRQVCLQLARESGFDVVSHVFEQFEPEGVMAR